MQKVPLKKNMEIKFNDSEGFTLGVELETQLLDRESLGLVQTSSMIMDSLKEYGESIKHELMMSNLEVISGVCSTVAEADEDLREKVRAVIRAAEKHSTLLCYASTHPFSLWRDQEITEDRRYMQLLENLQMVGRRFNIFGLHVHVGVEGGERCIYIMNRLLYYLPHLLALSTNSPFWEGMNSGLMSYRTKVFENLPAAGLPFYFHDFSDYTKLVNNYLATGTIKTIRELWWDVRPHPDFGTIEVRICDIPSTLKETLGITALIQALVKRFSDEYDGKVNYLRPHSAITRENKWRACRYGVEGEFLGPNGGTTINVKDAVMKLLEWVEPDSLGLGSIEYLKGVEDILKNGTGASRQLKVWKETGDLKEVVRDLKERLAEEILAGEERGEGS